MISFETLRKLALTLPETTEEPHFEKTSFRVKNKIFATFDAKFNRACIKLSEINQNVFITADSSNIYPVNNKWGKQGWTFIEMSKIKNDLFADTITTAYSDVAPKKLAEQVKQNFSNE